MKKNKINFLKIAIITIIIILSFLIGYNIKTIEPVQPIDNTIESNITLINNGSIEDEDKLEVEGFEESNSDLLSGFSRKTENIIIGNSQVLGRPIYYSQIDNRWKDEPYTSTSNPSQTIGSSGCGPTSSAMIIAGIKDSSVTPKTMADLYVKNGFRSADNGTYASAFEWTANTYNTDFKRLYNLDDGIQAIKDGYYEVVSCSKGLFTTGGHYIVIYGIEGDILKIYDPYLYSGKFNTPSRANKVTVSGNTVYCTVSNFKNYANSKGWFAFKSKDEYIPKYIQGQIVLIDEPVGIAYDNGIDVLVDNGLNQFWINKSVITSDNRLYGLATVVWDEENRVLVQIFETQFWTLEQYLSTEIPGSNNNSSEENKSPEIQPDSSGYVLGKYITNTNLNVRSGPSTNYKIIKTYKKGTKFDTKEISGDWAKTPSGWVNLNYCTLVNKY